MLAGIAAALALAALIGVCVLSRWLSEMTCRLERLETLILLRLMESHHGHDGELTLDTARRRGNRPLVRMQHVLGNPRAAATEHIHQAGRRGGPQRLADQEARTAG